MAGKFWSDERGASSLEYALMLGAIVGVLVFATGFVGVTTKKTLVQLAGGETVAATETPGVTPARRMEVPGGSWTLLAAGTCIFFNALLLAWIQQRSRNQLRRLEDDFGPMAKEVVKEEQDVIFRKRQDILKVLSKHLQGLFENRLQVKHLMSIHPTTVKPDEPLESVVATMRSHRFRHVLVCDDEQNLLGIISSRDVRWCQKKKASDVMTPNPFTIDLDAMISTSTTIFLKERISCLPVVEEGKLRGILTTTDLLMALQCLLQLTQRATAERHLSLSEDAASSYRISELMQA